MLTKGAQEIGRLRAPSITTYFQNMTFDFSLVNYQPYVFNTCMEILCKLSAKTKILIIEISALRAKYLKIFKL